VESIFFHNRIVLLKFNPFGGVLAVFGSDVTAHTWQTAGFVLCALQNHLYSISFLCHCFKYYSVNTPFAFASFNTEEMPLLLIVLMAVDETFNVIHFPSSGTKKRLV